MNCRCDMYPSIGESVGDCRAISRQISPPTIRQAKKRKNNSEKIKVAAPKTPSIAVAARRGPASRTDGETGDQWSAQAMREEPDRDPCWSNPSNRNRLYRRGHGNVPERESAP